jgi:hypothetical protein
MPFDDEWDSAPLKSAALNLAQISGTSPPSCPQAFGGMTAHILESEGTLGRS